MSEQHEVIAEALERLEAVTQTRRRNGNPVLHDEFALLERQRLMAWAAESSEHAEALAWVADHMVFTLQCVAFYLLGYPELAMDIVDASFASIRQAFT